MEDCNSDYTSLCKGHVLALKFTVFAKVAATRIACEYIQGRTILLKKFTLVYQVDAEHLSKTEKIVAHLVTPLPYKGYQFYCDNFYISVQFFYLSSALSH